MTQDTYSILAAKMRTPAVAEMTDEIYCKFALSQILAVK